jgi:starch-binding outer membrane protein, SusD/RagB family
MKRFNIKLIATVILTLCFVSCDDLLDETPRSNYTPEFFKTPQGVAGGITSLYASLRNIYGNPFYFAGMQYGTDESTWGALNNGDARNADFTGVGAITSTQNPYAAIWGLFPSINTASGIIENGEAAGVSPALVAEARFFRAFYYFLQVQTFGGVPLDLGAGELKFNTSPKRISVRNTVPEVYTKAIFPDLLEAIAALPAKSRLTGTVNTTVAQLFLAKAYLTYAWWLQNPNGIPTYPAADRTDPDGHDDDYYFQQAYNIATAAIATHDASIALETNYYDVNLGSNDRGKEWLLYADHTQSSDLYNGSPVNEFSSLAAPRNQAAFFTTWNYTNIRSTDPNSTPLPNAATSSVQREAAQEFGRPFTSVAPTRELLLNIFADKTNDSRYDGTFVTVYHGNWKKGGLNQVSLNNANGMAVVNDAPILTILDTDPGTVSYAAGAGITTGNVGAGTIPGRADWIFVLSNSARIWYPALWKINNYRTDNGTGLGSGNNAGLTRPFPIAKFSELYFIAAEAAAKGATGAQSARDLINVIRARAGRWRYDNNDRVVFVADNSAAMMAATPVTVDVNYILDERSREYYGEGFRWFDLVRTQTWSTRAASYSICGTTFGDRTPVVNNRTIPLTAYLRPIPQSQLDGMEMTAEEKANYQNPGY